MNHGELRYEQMSTPKPTYLVYLDDSVIAVVSKGKFDYWTASTTSRPHLSFPGQNRHEAVMALLTRLNEIGMIGADPDGRS